MEPCEFFPGNSFSVASAVSDWAGYDEDGEESVALYELKAQFVRSQKRCLTGKYKSKED